MRAGRNKGLEGRIESPDTLVHVPMPLRICLNKSKCICTEVRWISAYKPNHLHSPAFPQVCQTVPNRLVALKIPLPHPLWHMCKQCPHGYTCSRFHWCNWIMLAALNHACNSLSGICVLSCTLSSAAEKFIFALLLNLSPVTTTVPAKE